MKIAAAEQPDTCAGGPTQAATAILHLQDDKSLHDGCEE